MTGASAGRDAVLEASLRVARGGWRLHVDLTVAPGDVVAILGPNGAGKSTALELLAGLLVPDDGAIRLGDAVWDDPRRGVHLPPEDRAVGVVFQDYLLFPHLSVLENVAFGLRSRGVRRGSARARAAEWLDRVGLSGHAAVRPGELSGGQAQRVALARALVTEPDLLLLDEPLAALDVLTRGEVRSQLRRHLVGYAGRTVLVTHDPVDAMVLADRVVVVEAGAVVQSGPPAEVARAPRTEYVARLVGLNLYSGTALGTDVALEAGGVLRLAQAASGDVLVAVAPSAVALHRHRPEGSPRNVWPGRVTRLERHADIVRVLVDGRPAVLADVTTAAVAELGLDVGRAVWVSVKATELRAYPR